MSFIQLRKMREKRANLAEQARAILTKAREESRELTSEEDANFEAIHSDIESISRDIDCEERQADLESGLEESRGRQIEDEPETREERHDGPTPEQRDEAFRSWIRFGMNGIPPEQRAIMTAARADLTPEQRAQAIGTDSAGGYLVPEGFWNQVVEARARWGGMRRARTFVFTTASGNPLPIPTDNDTSQTGELLSENTRAAEQDVTFGQVVLNAYMYSSKLVKVSLQLLQDSAFDVESFLARKFGRRLGTITNTHFTTGTGTGQPEGVVTGATLGKTGTTGQTTTVTVADLYDLKHSVDPDYREGAEWMFKDSTLLAIKKLEDASNRPLWQAGLNVNEPNTIDGDRYIVNQSVAAMAASAKSILYGDFSQYYIRDVEGMTLLRLSERYAENLQVAFLAFSRHDGALIDAGTNPIKYYQNSAT